MVRMTSSGTEATMTAIRLARGHTGRNKIVKFEGCYHGHSDSLLVKAGSGALTMGVPSSTGVPEALSELTITLNYNDLEQVKQVFSEVGEQIAAIIVEPVAGNMNCILPEEGFLQGLREICDEYQSVLIFDEVKTGFRLAPGGASEYFGVLPDLSTFAKAMGNGYPIAAIGGKKEIMMTMTMTLSTRTSMIQSMKEKKNLKEMMMTNMRKEEVRIHLGIMGKAPVNPNLLFLGGLFSH